MIIDVVTLFPGMFNGFLEASITKRAQKKKLVNINLYNIRDFSLDKHKKVDDRPYGGGPGMLLMADPILKCFDYLKSNGRKKSHKIILTPIGDVLTQKKTKTLSEKSGLVLLCGHYEGFDQRIFDLIEFDDNISIGRYILSGGELAAMVVMDTIIRLIPGVLGNQLSYEKESFSRDNEFDYPQYTRPYNLKGYCVPDVLVSGNHQAINTWRCLHQRAIQKKIT
jgi:tRNA (guanine37-N1)-methyltransferase